jgi:hypothetical protein
LGQVGGYLAVPAAVNLVGNILVAAIESALVKAVRDLPPVSWCVSFFFYDVCDRFMTDL